MNMKPCACARMAVSLLVVILMSSTVIQSQTPRNFAQVRREFKTFYEQGNRKNGIVGSSFMLIQDGQVIAQEFFGLANQEKQQPVDESTIYHWASITKTFTGIAIMQLRDRGLLKLEDPIIKYVPELKAAHNPFGQMSDITIKHLMTHSAGFRGATWPWGGDKAWQPHEPTEWSQLVAMMPYTEILFKPGSKFSYSNPGIIFLGRVIEQLSGDSFEVYVDKNIFKPLEMYRSYFDATPYHLLKNRSASYWLKEGKLAPARFDADTGITVSNGGLNAPLPDSQIHWLSDRRPSAAGGLRSSVETQFAGRNVPTANSSRFDRSRRTFGTESQRRNGTDVFHRRQFQPTFHRSQRRTKRIRFAFLSATGHAHGLHCRVQHARDGNRKRSKPGHAPSGSGNQRLRVPKHLSTFHKQKTVRQVF